MIKIKFIPSGQFYTSRSLKVFSDDKTFFIPANKILTLEEENINSLLRFKLDYHSKDLNIKPEAEDTYILVYFKCREALPLYLIDLMFRNSLDTRIVTKKEFNEPFKSEVLLNRTNIVNKKSSAFIKLLTLSVVISVLQLSILLIGNLSQNLNIIFGLFSIVNALSFLWVWKNRKTLFYNQLYVKLSMFVIFSFVFLYYTFYMNLWISGIFLVLLLLLISNLLKFSTTKKKNLSS